ncbi:hypothetical protein KQ945_01725 [Bacillus subtilis subsp. subtilis]|nr:hypothetical protein [Bacillus subtilis subsp. subtilis]
MDDRRQRRRYALVAGVLGIPGAVCGGAGAALLLSAAWEGAVWPALVGLVSWLALIAWGMLSWRYLRQGRDGLRAGRWPLWDGTLWVLLIVGLVAACCVAALSGLLMLGGLLGWEPGMLAAGAMLLLFGPALMWPAFMLVGLRARE